MEFELENVHLLILALTAFVILYSDHQGLDYLRQKKVTLSKRSITRLHRMVWIGLLGMVVTGIALVIPAWEHYLTEPSFYVKMGFVLTLAVNGVFIGKLSHTAADTPYPLLESETKKSLLLSGALSSIGWVGATVVGFFFL